MSIAALVIAVLSLVVAGIALVYSRRATVANEALAKIERERRADEVRERDAATAAARRADVRLRVQGGGSDLELLVENRGRSEATDVTLESIASIGPGDAFELLGSLGPFVIPGGDHHRIPISLDYGTAGGTEYRITWNDADGPHAERQQIRLPGR